jgi:hypothetical protein
LPSPYEIEQDAAQPRLRVDRKKIIEFTTKWFSHFEKEYETYIHPRLKENYQHMQNYDEVLTTRRWRSRRVVRQAVTIPKVQPEMFARMANKLASIVSAAPVFRVPPPKNADVEIIRRSAVIEAGVNDLMESDGWLWHWYDVEFWSNLAPYVAVEVKWAQDVEYMPVDESEVSNEPETDVLGRPMFDQFGAQVINRVERLRFEEQVVRMGGRTRVWHPWEFFFDYTVAAKNEIPLCFIRELVPTEDVEYNFDSGAWVRPDDAEGVGNWRERRPSSFRNYGLEIIRSVPGKGTSASTEVELDKTRHEVIHALARVYDPNQQRITIQRWSVLNRDHLLVPPTEQKMRRVKFPYIVYCQKPIPATSMGIAPAEAEKQIQRATDQLFNAGLETIYYGLSPVTYMGAGVDFADENPVYAPCAHIPLTGPTSDIKTVQPPFDPGKVFGTLDYLDKKGHLVSDVSDSRLGALKPGTPSSATEIGEANQGVATKLGMFVIIDTYQFLRKWAELMYWVTMEKNPIHFPIRGASYNLRDWVIPGGPQFDLPQVAEVSGRASDRVLQLSAYSQFRADPVIASIPARAEKLLEKTAYAMGYTAIGEVLNPQSEQTVMPQIFPETMQLIMKQRGMLKEAQNQQGEENGKV